MKRKQAAAACLMAATMLFTGCTPNISEYAARAQQAGKTFFEGETTDAMAQNGADDPETSAVEDGTQDSTVASTNGEAEDGTAAIDSETQDSAVTTNGETTGIPATADNATTETGADGETSATGDSATNEAQSADTQTGAESTTATAPQIPASMTEVTDSVYEAYAQKSDAFTGKLAGHDKLSRAETAAMTAVLSEKEYSDKTLCLQNMAKYDSSANESFLLMFESTQLTARGRISGDLWYYDGETAKFLEKGIVVTGLKQVTGIGTPFVILELEASGKKQAAVWMVTDQKCEKLFEDAETIEATTDGVCAFYPAEKTVYDPLVSEWDSAEETVPVYYERTADGFAETAYRELSASEYLAYASAEDSDEEAQAWKEELEEKFYTQTDEDTEYTYWFYAIGEDKVAYRCRTVSQSVGEEDGIDHAAAKYSWCVSKLDQGKLTSASETTSGDGFFFPSRSEQEEALDSLNDIPNEFTKNRLDKVQKTARATLNQAIGKILEVQEYPEDTLCFAETADYDGDGKKETFAAIGRYDGAFGAPVCDLWFVGADGAVLEEENFVLKALEKLGNSYVLYHGYEVSGVSDLLFGVQEQGAVCLLNQMGRFELDEDGDLMAWTAGETASAPGYYDISLRTLKEYQTEIIPEKELLQYKNGKAVLRSALRQVGQDRSRLQILYRENDMIHINFFGNSESWYETWKIENDRLVLTDSGEGSVKKAGENGDIEAAGGVSENSASGETAAPDTSENAATAEAAGSVSENTAAETTAPTASKNSSASSRSAGSSKNAASNAAADSETATDTESSAFDFRAPTETAQETQTEQE